MQATSTTDPAPLVIAGSPFRRDLVVVGLLALAVRVAFAIVRRDAPLSLDSLDYIECGRAILEGRPWPAQFRPPGWPLVVSWTLAVGQGSSHLPAIGLNILLSAALAPVTFALALRVLPRPRALAAAAIVALHPSLLYLTPAVLTEPLAWLLVALFALGLCRAGETRGRVPPFVLGLVAGELWLVRAAMVLFLPLAAAFPRPSSANELLRRSAALLLGAATIVAPSLLLVRARTGLVGSAPGSAEHMFWMGARPERLVAERQVGDLPEAKTAVDGKERARLYLDAALGDYARLARENPGQALLFPFRKFFALHELTSSGQHRGLALATQLPLTLLALWGARALARSGRAGAGETVIVLLATAAVVAIPPLVTMPWTRYYSPLIPLFAPLVAAVGLDRIPDGEKS